MVDFIHYSEIQRISHSNKDFQMTTNFFPDKFFTSRSAELLEDREMRKRLHASEEKGKLHIEARVRNTHS